jgi:hypothetical protein
MLTEHTYLHAKLLTYVKELSPYDKVKRSMVYFRRWQELQMADIRLPIGIKNFALRLLPGSVFSYKKQRFAVFRYIRLPVEVRERDKVVGNQREGKGNGSREG